jgi:hypothetical protein
MFRRKSSLEETPSWAIPLQEAKKTVSAEDNKIPAEALLVVQPAAVVVVHTVELETSIQGFNAPLASFLGNLGLPTEKVLVDFKERRFVLQSMQATLDVLPHDERTKAFYLSKFSVAIMVGLFDAALNFLWDEVILALRRLAVSIDLSYFFDTAEKRESYRSRLQSEEDLRLLDDMTLIDTCARVDLLSDVNRERLRHVNFMRNHASAAHPNQSELTGAEMVAWLSNCLKYAITAKPDHAVIATKQLLTNIRTTLIPEKDIPVIAIDLQKFSPERVDDLLWTLFGIYVDPSQKAECRTNIANLAHMSGNLEVRIENFKLVQGMSISLSRAISNAEHLRMSFSYEWMGGDTVRKMFWRENSWTNCEIFMPLITA